MDKKVIRFKEQELEMTSKQKLLRFVSEHRWHICSLLIIWGYGFGCLYMGRKLGIKTLWSGLLNMDEETAEKMLRFLNAYYGKGQQV